LDSLTVAKAADLNSEFENVLLRLLSGSVGEAIAYVSGNETKQQGGGMMA
jgi:hypothetical protein